jgi:hypothetical protein
METSIGNLLAYKPGLTEVMERLRALYSRTATDRILAGFEAPGTALAEFAAEHAGTFCEYPEPEGRARFWEKRLEERAALEDDSVPVAYLSEFDQGLYGGLVGGEVRFLAHPENGWISSMVPPLLADWNGFERLEFCRDGLWAGRYLRQLRVFAEAARGKFGVSHFILIDGLNFVFELVGATDTYLSLTEEPGMVRRAIDLAFDVNLWVQERFFETVPLLEGGTCSNMAQWLPGRIVSESVDPFHMTSVKYFEAWGREPIERIFGRFDSGVLHLHGNGRHLLEAIAGLPGLKCVLMNDDTGYAPAYTKTAEFRARAGDLPLVVFIPLAEFVAGLERHTLTAGVFYKVKGEVEASEANRLMERVRAYRCG